MAVELNWTLASPACPGRFYYRDVDEAVGVQECHVEYAPDRTRPDLVARFPFVVRPVEELTGEWAGPVAEPG